MSRNIRDSVTSFASLEKEIRKLKAINLSLGILMLLGVLAICLELFPWAVAPTGIILRVFESQYCLLHQGRSRISE